MTTTPEQAVIQAIKLIDEVNERATSREFYGVNQTLHAKLCTIRATLTRLTHSQPASEGLREALKQAYEAWRYRQDRLMVAALQAYEASQAERRK